MGSKSRPEGWLVEACIGYCRWRGIKCNDCVSKKLFEDCRKTCLNSGKTCDICDNTNSEYEEEEMKPIMEDLLIHEVEEQDK